MRIIQDITQGLILQRLIQTIVCCVGCTLGITVVVSVAVLVLTRSEAFLSLNLILLFQILLLAGLALLESTGLLIAILCIGTVHHLFYLSIVLFLSLILHIVAFGSIFFWEVPLERLLLLRLRLKRVGLNIHE